MNPTTAYILLGSNDDAERHLREAVQLLRRACTVLKVSSVYATEAEAGGTGTYWNAVVQIETGRDPAEFKRSVLRAIEQALGRNRDTRSVVAIDLDIALWGNTPLDYGDKPWHSPAPDIVRYGYVAVPLAEIAPNLVHPETGEPLADIARRLTGPSIVKLDSSLDAV